MMEQIAIPSSRQFVPALSDPPIFSLGEFVVGTLARGMENFYGALHKVMRKWSNDVVVRSLLNLMVILNPRLNVRQQRQLMSILLKTVDNLIWERSLDIRVMSGIMALACPNQDTGLLFGYLMEVIAGLACYDGQAEENIDLKKTTQLDLESRMVNSVQADEVDVKAAQALYHHFTIEQSYVAAMSPKVRKACLAALNGGMEFPPQLQSWVLQPKQRSPPICPITLEPLLRQDGTIASDVVAVIQRSSTIGKEHAFLYRGRALYGWLGQSTVPRNPETRSLVRPTDIYRLS
ncbi:unnamed protein product [Calypogeia fissa]